jgi:two-component system, OmpR family, alkaline phosphatase synthesis response regulator PhoP
MAANTRILVVEDDADILELITVNLERHRFEVQGVESGEKALKLLRKKKPDLMLLDLMLTGMDGLDVCRQMRGDPAMAGVPVIMVTAKGEESDIVAGLELGADDYIVKPFSPRVLVARVKAVLRRRSQSSSGSGGVIHIHDLIIHPGRHEVQVKNKTVDLTFTEFRILHLLASRPGWVLTRYQIVDAVHGDDYPVTERSVDVQVVGLRKKLGAAGKYIETVRGVGYRFKD